MGLFSKLFGPSARDEAIRLGISASNATHNAIVQKHQELIACTKYSLSRTATSDATWSLEQCIQDQPSNPHFFKSPGGQGGYLLKTNATVSDVMKKVFAELAEEFSEEFFAFEGSATEVSIYWEECGGAKNANQLYRALQKMRTL